MRPARPLRFSSVAALAVLAAYAVWIVFPMVWVAYSSLKPAAQIFHEPLALPEVAALQWENYAQAWSTGRFGAYFLNSVVVTVVSVAGIVGLGSMAAYALSRFWHPLRGAIFWLFLAGLMIPAQLAVVPLFFQLRGLGLLESLPGLILVYIANGLPFAVFVLAGFFRTLPRALHEAAILDGASEWQAFSRVMLPLARPGLVTVAIFQFIGVWKEYFFAFMLLGGATAGGGATLPLGLGNLALAAQYQGDQGMLFAGIVIVTLPLLVVYVLLQRQIVAGVAAGALKG